MSERSSKQAREIGSERKRARACKRGSKSDLSTSTSSPSSSPSQQVVNGPFKIIPHSKTSKKTLYSFYYSFPHPPIHPWSKAINNIIMIYPRTSMHAGVCDTACVCQSESESESESESALPQERTRARARSRSRVCAQGDCVCAHLSVKSMR